MHCGRSSAYDPVMPFPRRLLTDDEEVIREFRQHWRMLFVPIMWMVVGIAAIYLAYRIAPDDATIDLITAVVVALALIPLAIYPLVSWWFTWYVLTTERLITRSGIVARQGVDIPLENINNVIFSQSFIERVLSSGDLIVESAGATGQSHFHNIRDPDEFQALLYKVREDRAKALEGGSGGFPRDDATAQLERLARLHRDGVISDEEFAAKRQAFLDRM